MLKPIVRFLIVFALFYAFVSICQTAVEYRDRAIQAQIKRSV